MGVNASGAELPKRQLYIFMIGPEHSQNVTCTQDGWTLLKIKGNIMAADKIDTRLLKSYK